VDPFWQEKQLVECWKFGTTPSEELNYNTDGDGLSIEDEFIGVPGEQELAVACTCRSMDHL
jgi:hypothetical protein